MSFGTGNFTIEGWFFTGDKSISGGANRVIVGNSGNSYTMQLYIDSSGFLTFGNTGSTFIQGSTDLANNTWHHFAISRSGTSTNQIAMWVDGTRVAQGTNSQNYTSGTIYIGAFGTTDGFWNGYISNLRIVKGSAVYDPANSTITVPTTPLTAITNTALLTCQTNRFFDGSANAYTVTATGSPSVQRFNPFGTSTAYSTSVIGGSGYFDTSGDFLTFSPSTSFAFGTGDFTIEFWINTGNVSADGAVLDSTTNGSYWAIRFSGTTLYYQSASGITNLATPTIATLSQSAWTHVALVRASGTTKIYANGVQVSSTADSTNYTATTTYQIAKSSDSSRYTGYFSDIRVVKGTAVYTAAFTPPTAPLTAITNTSLLTNFTNGAIFDNAMMNDLETVGNAQISTSVKKYGTGSMYFDGTGDFLKIPPSPQFNFGTGNFTIEMWAYCLSTAGNPTLFASGPNTASGFGLILYPSTTLVFANAAGASIVTDTAAFPINTWTYVTLVRSNGTLTLYINGVSVSSATFTTAWDGSSLSSYVGQWLDGTTFPWNGYIDDLRITKGYARYTANFTPPTTAFSDTGPY
jgi:hypothetical protein